MLDLTKLIYTPLLLDNPPDAPLEKVMQWIRDSKAEHETLQADPAFRREDEVRRWTWFRRFVTYPGQPTKFLADFDKRFPELIEYVKTFPIQDPSLLLILQTGNSDKDFGLHFDNDLYFGARFYWFNESPGDRLYFRELKEHWPSNHTKICKEPTGWIFTDADVHPEKLIAKTPDHRRYPWALNGFNAPHAVIPTDDPNNVRAVVFVKGKRIQPDFNKLLRKSVEAFGDSAIFCKK
jgi:hypothetical protein